MERTEGRTLDASARILAMSAHERRIAFEKAYQGLASLQTPPSEIDPIDLAREKEGLLIGTILTMRRLGVTPSGFRVNLTEIEARTTLQIDVSRGNEPPITEVLEVGKEGRPPQLEEILGKTIKSFRNRR